ncbi:arabinosyltransferase domain-containing protein [Actinomycetospora cinnamomea]|uniref:EmbC-like arabinotransferase in arabinogalactan biosynthesis n=1 Tax=Actinomycetospora cinnamomea TaxID=663609 RepID=A0A2U1EWC5_9PSEU|nr:arabinosyltransferase domain-containing protein [Actinomycetospora cinnamomea]PVZ04243.1 EmbC-like arabinotransferase in arabinogalactan biosynthesis [Actinomycetospora cinnamomea]
MTPARGTGRAAPAAAVAGLVAVLCALLLPFAPVSVNEPTVRWPVDPSRPESTLLTLTAYRPLALDLRFSCDVARQAGAEGSGVVVSTALPGSPEAGVTGLLVTAADGRVAVRALDRVLVDEPLPTGPCAYRVTGRSAGRPTDVRPSGPGGGARAPGAFAGPGDAELVVTRDGRELARAADDQLPDVDVLVTSVTTLPPDAAGDLAVRLRVDDEFTSSPTPLKNVLTAVLVLALLAAAGLLVAADRTSPEATPRRSRRPRWPGRPRVVDLAVPAVLAVWTFVAPATDDDGYFATQARNAVLSGEVGNYYQFYDQSFVPFTWVSQGLGAWQQLAGFGPVPQRVPALVLGVLTWLVLRRVAAPAFEQPAGPAAPGEPDGPVGRWRARAGPVVLGVVFLAWWVPYDMGVRPEAVVALCGVAAMHAVLVTGRDHRLAPAWVACALAGVGFTAHTTGVTMVAPLLAGLPALWPVLRVPGARVATAGRVVAVASGAMIAPLLGFADGALRDFRRGQALFLSVLEQDGWTAEFERYAYLLDEGAMGNFAKRAAVLACLVALAWYAVLAVAARARHRPLPAPLTLAATTTALSFVALAATPSKWTHHFGALAGVGPAFLGVLLVTAVPLTRRVLDGARPPGGVVAAAAGSVVAAIALAWHGPNSWPYAWLDGVRTPHQPPSIRNVGLDSPLLWALAVGLVALVLAWRSRGSGVDAARRHALWALPIVVVVSLAATTAYTVGSFGVAAVRGVPPGSMWARTTADPLGSGCGATSTIRVLDPFTARPLAPAGLPAPSPPAGFVPDAGYYANNRPQGSVTAGWGSLAGDDAGPAGQDTAEQSTGEMSTGWYALPDAPGDGSTVIVTAAGTLAAGNELVAEYGRRTGASPAPTGEQALADTLRSPSWRTLTLAPPPGSDVVRLHAVDRTGDLHGWLAFTAPALARPVDLRTHLRDGFGADAPVALGWHLAFAHPCLRPPAVVDGITEPPVAAILRVDGPRAALDDIAWQPARGGVFGQVARSRSVLALATVGPVDPDVRVYVFGTPLARDAYTLTTEQRTVPGARVAISAPPAPR